MLTVDHALAHGGDRPLGDDESGDAGADGWWRWRWTTGGTERWASVVFLLVAAAVVAYRMSGFFVDDGLITMRFSERLASGEGWTYNVGERTANGATSPGLTAALAALSFLLGTVARASNVLFVVSFAAIAGLLTAMFHKRDVPWAGFVAAALVLACPMVLATKGLESLPFLALVCAVLWAGNSDHDATFGVLAVLLVLVRGEGALLAGAVFVHMWVTRRRMPQRAAVAATLAALPWLAYSLMTFHTLVPDALGAKVAQRQSGYWGEGWIFLKGFYELTTLFGSTRWLLVITPLAAGGLVRGLVDGRIRSIVAPLLTATVLHTLAYGLALNVPSYHWYYVWELFTLALLAGLAVGWLIEQLLYSLGQARAPTRPPPSTAGRATVIGVLGLGALLIAANVHINTSADNKHYIQLGEWLASHTEPTARIAATEIGTIGWYSDRSMVDYLGLLSTDSARELRNGDLASWLEREEPDYWVAHEPLWPHETPAATQPWFDHVYRPIHTSETTPQGDQLVVYERRTFIHAAKQPSAHAPR